MSDTQTLFDSEGFKVNPRPPLRLADLPAAFKAVEAEEPTCRCRPSPVRRSAKAVGLPWNSADMTCPVHGGRR